jgi:DNA-binding XRE family transcriptional regulator
MNEFKQIRKELKLTQLEVAEFIGVTRMSVLSWEKSNDPPAYAILSIRHLKALQARLAINEAMDRLNDALQ